MSTSALLSAAQSRVEEALHGHLNRLESNNIAPLLIEAMRYSVLNGGKRIRAALVYAAADSVPSKLPADAWDDIACAIEMIHAYSLVHDDLPAMDDDNYRRNLPSCHVKYGEAVAILTGDALQAHAFEILAHCQTLPVQLRTEVMCIITKAIGSDGMAGGQTMDILATERDSITPEHLRTIYQAKTGQLIRASILSGACEQKDTEQCRALDKFSDYIGLGFQIKDDLIDIHTDMHKPNLSYPKIIGEDATKAELEQLHLDALNAIKPYPNTKALRILADYIIKR